MKRVTCIFSTSYTKYLPSELKTNGTTESAVMRNTLIQSCQREEQIPLGSTYLDSVMRNARIPLFQEIDSWPILSATKWTHFPHAWGRSSKEALQRMVPGKSWVVGSLEQEDVLWLRKGFLEEVPDRNVRRGVLQQENISLSDQVSYRDSKGSTEPLGSLRGLEAWRRML